MQNFGDTSDPCPVTKELGSCLTMGCIPYFLKQLFCCEYVKVKVSQPLVYKEKQFIT